MASSWLGGQGIIYLTLCSLWQGSHLLMYFTNTLGSKPGSILDIPFPFDYQTPLGLYKFISSIGEKSSEDLYLMLQSHIRCLGSEVFCVH